MPLINLQTSLKDLKYGHDRPNGNSSNQPYLAKPFVEDGNFGGAVNLPVTEIGGVEIGGNFNVPNTPDFLVRGGALAPFYGVQDVIRLGEYFTDLKSPSGLFFSLKQNILSRTSVRTESSARIFNDGLYLPTSTLAQAGVVGLGFHLNKQGLNPFSNRYSYRNAVQYDQYSKTAGDIAGGFTAGSTDRIFDPTSGEFTAGAPSPNSPGSYNSLTDNRLVALYRVKVKGDLDNKTINGISINKNDINNLLEYSGGPGSILGIGKTKIKLHCGETRFRKSIQYGTDRSTYIYEELPSKINNIPEEETSLSENDRLTGRSGGGAPRGNNYPTETGEDLNKKIGQEEGFYIPQPAEESDTFEDVQNKVEEEEIQ